MLTRLRKKIKNKLQKKTSKKKINIWNIILWINIIGNIPLSLENVKNNLITNFYEKPKLKDPINIGFYFFKTKVFLNIKINHGEDLETSLLPKLSKSKKLACHIHTGYHFTVNSQKDLLEARQLYKKNKKFFENF